MADADAAASLPVLGLSIGAVSVGRVGTFLRQGYIGLASWTWVVNGRLYASGTAGELTQVVPVSPALAQEVGVAITSTSIDFDPTPSSEGAAGVDTRGFTLVVAASDSLDPSLAPAAYRCSGAADQVEINAAIAAVNARGSGSVLLLEGSYDITAPINILGPVRLKGSGAVLRVGNGANLNGAIIEVGDNISTYYDIVIRDLEIDGNEANQTGNVAHGIRFRLITRAEVSGCYIHDTYPTSHAGGDGINVVLGSTWIIINNNRIDNPGNRGVTVSGATTVVSDIQVTENRITDTYDRAISIEFGALRAVVDSNICITGEATSMIGIQEVGGIVVSNNICRDATVGVTHAGIKLIDSTECVVDGNTCENNNQYGILLNDAPKNIISNNIVRDNSDYGIRVHDTDVNSNGNIIEGNLVISNGDRGIVIESDYCEILGNRIELNQDHGLSLSGEAIYNLVEGNYIMDNSQSGHNTLDGIFLFNADYNTIRENTVIGVSGTTHRYGIQVSANCDENRIFDNTLVGNATLQINDDGVNTRLPTVTEPFVDGSDPQDSGFLIDATGEYARTYMFLPPGVQQVIRMKIYARSNVLEADSMRIVLGCYGAAENENYQTHDGSAATLLSETNFAADDIIEFISTQAGLLAMLGGDSLEVKVSWRAAGGGHAETDAYFRTVSIEYV